MEKTNQQLQQEIKALKEQVNREFIKHQTILRDHEIKIRAVLKTLGDMDMKRETNSSTNHGNAIKEYEGFEQSVKQSNGVMFP